MDTTKHEAYADWVSRYPALDPGATSELDDVAFQLYSSGTTGRPKGVMLSNTNFFGLLPVAKEIWELTPDAVNLVAMPLFHIAGGGWATAGMYEGCTSVIVRELDPAALVGMFGDLGITHALLVPAALQFMLMVPGIEDADFSSLRIMVYGASPISEAVLRKSIEVFKCKFWQAYGMTESTGTVVNLPPEDHDLSGPNTHRLRSCGVAGPGVELRIVDVDTPVDGTADAATDLPTGEVGEIWVRSPQVMKGYWKMPDETGEDDHARWLAPNGRRRLPRRRRLPVHPRSREGHDRVGWGERVPGRGRERADEPSGGRRLRPDRGAARDVG